jgi:hypothetical protein
VGQVGIVLQDPSNATEANKALEQENEIPRRAVAYRPLFCSGPAGMITALAITEASAPTLPGSLA